MYYSTDFLVCISIAPRNNVCEAREFSVNFWNSFRKFSVKVGIFSKHPVKSRIFLRESGWSLSIAAPRMAHLCYAVAREQN